MEIKIDTKRDSADDIKKVIDLLLKFIEADRPIMSDTTTVGDGSFNMFGDTPVSSEVFDSDEKDDNDDDTSGVSIIEY